MMDNFSSSLNYYHPSGVFPLAGIAALFAGCAGGAVLGAVYAFVNHHMPLVYLNVLLLCGFGFSLGWLGSWGVRKSRVRSASAAVVMGAVIFLTAYVSHWFFYISTVLVDWETDSPYSVMTVFNLALDFMRDPGESWEVIQGLNEEGVWSISKLGSSSSRSRFEPKGLVLAAIWLIEALFLMYPAVKRTWEEACKPYSERQGEWMKPQELPVPIAFIEDPEEFKKAVDRGDYSMLTAQLPPSDEDVLKFANVCLYSDALESYVSVKNVSVTNKKKKETDEVVRYLKISPQTAADILSALAGSPA